MTIYDCSEELMNKVQINRIYRNFTYKVRRSGNVCEVIVPSAVITSIDKDKKIISYEELYWVH